MPAPKRTLREIILSSVKAEQEAIDAFEPEKIEVVSREYKRFNKIETVGAIRFPYDGGKK